MMALLEQPVLRVGRWQARLRALARAHLIYLGMTMRLGEGWNRRPDELPGSFVFKAGLGVAYVSILDGLLDRGSQEGAHVGGGECGP